MAHSSRQRGSEDSILAFNPGVWVRVESRYAAISLMRVKPYMKCTVHKLRHKSKSGILLFA